MIETSWYVKENASVNVIVATSVTTIQVTQRHVALLALANRLEHNGSAIPTVGARAALLWAPALAPVWSHLPADTSVRPGIRCRLYVKTAVWMTRVIRVPGLIHLNNGELINSECYHFIVVIVLFKINLDSVWITTHFNRKLPKIKHGKHWLSTL